MTTNDEKRGRRRQKEFENFLRGGKIVALLATLPAHGRQSESNFWCGLLAPWEQSSIAIVGRSRARETTVSPEPPGTYLSVRHQIYRHIFSVFSETLFTFVQRRLPRSRAPPPLHARLPALLRTAPDSGRSDRRGIAETVVLTGKRIGVCINSILSGREGMRELVGIG